MLKDNIEKKLVVANTRVDLNHFEQKTSMLKNVLKTTGTFARSLNAKNNVAQTVGNQKRFLNLHEYQSQELFAKNGIAVPRGHAVSTPEEALQVAESIEKGTTILLFF